MRDRFGNCLVEFDFDVDLQNLGEKWPQSTRTLTLPGPLVDVMLVILPLDSLLCCSSSLTFGVTQLLIYRLDTHSIIPIYFSLLAIFALFSTDHK